MDKIISLYVPIERRIDVGTLIDYMGWGHAGDMDFEPSDAQLDAAEKVWGKCGVEPDYSYRYEDMGEHILFEFWPTHDARIMMSAIEAYLKATIINLHFTISDGPLSGRKMFFYDGPGDGARKLGYVWHNLEGWWVVTG